MRLTDFQKVVAMNTLSGIGTGFVGIFCPEHPHLLFWLAIIEGFGSGVFLDSQFLVLQEVPVTFGRTLLFIVAIALAALGHFELTFILVAAISVYFWFINIDKLTQRH